MRECGKCSLCCKLFKVDELAKPAGKWCQHCRPGIGGCVIHEIRPQVCRDFFCQWIKSISFGEEWKPNKCGMVVHFEENLDPPLCRILVDAGRIGHWREEPYARTTLGLVLSGLTGRDGRIYNTIATVGRRDWLILPNEDVEVTGMSYVVTEVEGTWSAKTLLSREVENKK